MPRLSKEQFEEWRTAHPVTLKFFEFLSDEANARRMMLAMGSFDRSKSFTQIGEEVFKALIQAEWFEFIDKIQYEDMIDEDSSSRPQDFSEAGEGAGNE